MDEKQTLERALDMAKQVLGILEQQAAGYTSLTIPAPLKLQLEDKRKEITDLESRLAQLSGQAAKALLDYLPRQGGFIGRKAEIEQCLAALAPEDRSWGVVIDGIGGMGKTALALEVAQQARSAASFAAYLFVSAKTNRMTIDGVREETLAATSLDAFVREFARLLGEQDIARVTDAIERRRALLDALRGRQVLLIWDNLETLTAEERKQIGDFLYKLPAPNKAIITSRYRAGESGFPIRLDRLAEADALELIETFGKRYRRVAGELRYAGKEARRTLYEAAGGSPLVLNLALGFIAQKGWSFQRVLSYVRDPERSKDLHTFLFADALQTISENDGAVLSALSAMQTPAEPGFLVEVTQRTDREIEMALEQLVMLSLVNDLEGGRYILHPLTRAYLQQVLTLNKSGEQPQTTGKLNPAIRRSVLQYWLDYAQQYREENPEHYQKLEAAWPNLEAAASALYELADIPALLNGQESPTAKEAVRMLLDVARALDNFWNWGYWDELIRLNEWGYEAATLLADWRNAGLRASQLASLYDLRGEREAIARWAERAESAMTRVGDRSGLAEAIRNRGLAARLYGDLERAKQLYQQALALFRALSEELNVALVLNDLGNIALSEKEYPSAEAYFLEGLAIYSQYNSKTGQAYVCSNLGLLAQERDQPAIARTWYERALALSRETGRQDNIAHAQYGLACVLLIEGRYAEALEGAEEALSIFERLRSPNVEEANNLIVHLRQKAQEQEE